MAVVAASSFRHGVHPPGHKERTQGVAIRQMPLAKTFVLPLSQHIGAPARAVVAAGAAVQRGQLVAEPGGFVSTSLHSPVTGRVAAIEHRRRHDGQLVEALVITADTFSEQLPVTQDHGDWAASSPGDFISLVQRGGLVGLGGAAFPSHVKFALKEGQRVDTMVVNGAECEPFLTCDHRIMVEQPEAVVRGALIAGERLGAKRVVIGVEDNKPDALAALDAVGGVDVVALKTRYPQGAEKILILAALGRVVPPGKLPLDQGVVVNNVATMAALAAWLDDGRPLVDRVVTVSGPGVASPANLLVPIGTPVRAVLEACGGVHPDASQVVMGGPMMGQPVVDLDAPVLKGTSGLLVFTSADRVLRDAGPCIRCGRCLEACAYDLNPSLLGRLARARRTDRMADHYLMDCMECGACTYACPASIPLVQLFRSAKAELRRLARKSA